MKVKAIFFVECVPGQPVYQMDNGDIRIPFPDGRTKAMLWITEEEAIKSLTVKNASSTKFIEDQFSAARKVVRQAKIRTLFSFLKK